MPISSEKMKQLQSVANRVAAEATQALNEHPQGWDCIEADDEPGPIENAQSILDGDDLDDLRGLYSSNSGASLIPSRYLELASLKIRAVEQRLSGNIQLAMFIEASFERAFNRLPERLKW